MTTTLPKFNVLLADGAEREVQVTLGDQLRGELEAAQQGLPLEFHKAPTHHTALWLWASLTRTGDLDVKFKDFHTVVLGVSRVGEPEPVDPGAGVDPTQQGQPTGGG